MGNLEDEKFGACSKSEVKAGWDSFVQMFREEVCDLDFVENSALEDVLMFWTELVDKFELDDALFFENEDAINLFLMKFEAFCMDLENEIEEVEKKIGFFHSKMSEGWKTNLRKAAYRAFLAHFGARRRSENDSYTGEKLDYVYHVFRATFECLAQSKYWFDEETMIAELGHDEREDLHKGFLSLLLASERLGYRMSDLEKELDEGIERSDTVQERFYLVSELFERFDSWAFGDVKDVGMLVDAVTKKGSNREKTMLHFWRMLGQDTNWQKVDYWRFDEGAVVENLAAKVGSQVEKMVLNGWGEGKSEFPVQYKLVPLKAGDRLQNMASMRESRKSDEIAEKIQGETADVFLLLYRCLENVHAADIMEDFLHLQDAVRRGALETLDRNVEEELGMEEKFLADFQERLDRKGGREYKMGEDYWIDFRETGARWLDLDHLEAMADMDPEKYARRFRKYVFFISAGEDECLPRFARKVFEDIFCSELKEKQMGRRELQSDLGKRVLENGGAGFDDREGGLGMGVWAVFENRESFGRNILGLMYSAYFLEDKEALRRIDAIFALICSLKFRQAWSDVEGNWGENSQFEGAYRSVKAELPNATASMRSDLASRIGKIELLVNRAKGLEKA